MRWVLLGLTVVSAGAVWWHRARWRVQTPDCEARIAFLAASPKHDAIWRASGIRRTYDGNRWQLRIARTPQRRRSA